MLRRIALVPILMVLASLAMGNTLICIDPGHGGSDYGGTGYITEKFIDVAAGLQLRDWLNLDTVDTRGGSAWDVIMTRSDDSFPSLADRVNYANSNNADRYLSIHSNQYNKESANGSETYCNPNAPAEGFDLRNKTQEELIAHGQRTNRGNKTATFYVITYTNMPSALTEMAFVSNLADSQCLDSASWRNEVTCGFMHGFQRHYGLTAYTPSYSEIIVDNSDAGYAEVGTWATSTSPGYYGTNSRYSDTGVGNDTATWTPNLTQGYYDVYAWWVSGTDRASNAPYAITHASGTANVSVNQSASGGQWNLLGNYSFNAGTGGYVVLTDNAEAGKVVSADAIKMVQSAAPTPTPTPTPPPGTDYIIDNDQGAPAYVETGSWSLSTSSGYNGGTYKYAGATTAATATWNATFSQAGNYQVFVIYRASTNRSTGAKFVVHTASGDQVVMVDQTVNNLVWVSLGTYAFNAGANSITLDAAGSSGNKRAVVIADAVRFTLIP